MEEDDNVQNIDDDDDDERGFAWDDAQDRDFHWLEADHVDHDEEEEEMFLSSKSPVERSGHIAVTDGSFMFVWGGYKVSHTHDETSNVISRPFSSFKLSFYQNADAQATMDLYLPKNEIWIYNMETARW